MVVKVYISGISGNKEVKKRQQRVLMILDSKNVEYEIIDITEPGKEDDKEYMQTNANPKDSKYPLPPQIFNEEDYCGDYEDFDLANEIDELEKFLKIIPLDDSADDNIEENNISSNNVKHSRNSSSREISMDKEISNVHSGSEIDERETPITDDNDLEKLKSSDVDESNKSVAEDMDQMDEIGNNNQKSDDEEQEE
ncbi:SH3 domain-binding glutamic acid-rich protein homolog [Microplitis mediator]|uniref:SH3 domain-binding glutamic acid-rich protein homolog n=1 Tax=Microplitis mediator TaxID=375433 RepID=UPI0025538067|nr:SH3 domain-binding glutamic acid-rich protein homolog [Microplitis mediator]